VVTQPPVEPTKLPALPSPCVERVRDAVYELEQMVSQLQIPASEAEKMVAILTKVRCWYYFRLKICL
jgi:hypothetical protein